MSWFSKAEQVTANVLKSIFMDTNRQIAESERQILEWESRLEVERRFVAKLSNKAHQQAIAAADQAQKEADALREAIAVARSKAQEHSQYLPQTEKPEPKFQEPAPFKTDIQN